jgi:hypothetical protein
VSEDISNQQSEATHHDLIDISGLPTSAIDLLKQLLASVAGKEEGKPNSTLPQKPSTTDKVAVKPDNKPKDTTESSTQGEARGNKVTAKPYCHRCLTKGHCKEECVTPLVCDICTSHTHIKSGCPLYKKANKVFAMTCGYAVDGLGFYYIPQSTMIKSKENGLLERWTISLSEPSSHPKLR